MLLNVFLNFNEVIFSETPDRSLETDQEEFAISTIQGAQSLPLLRLDIRSIL